MRGGIAKLRKQGAVLLSDLRANDKAEILCVYEKDAAVPSLPGKFGTAAPKPKSK